MQDPLIKRQKYIKGVIDRFEGSKAVIKLDDGQEIIWPKENLSDDTMEGAAVRLVLYNSKTDQEEREKIAKSVLNEILRTKGD